MKKHCVIKIILFVILGSQLLRAQSVNIPLNSVKKPASDLIYQDKVLDPSEASQISKNGLDISELNPKDNKFWQNQS